MAIDPAKAPFDFGTRDFSPKLGMWVQHEPLAYVGGLDAYLLVSDESRKP